MFDFSDDSGRLQPQGIWRCYDIATAIDQLRQEMLEAADALEFERAAALRDEIRFLQKESTPVTAPDPSTPPQVKRTRKRPRR